MDLFHELCIGFILSVSQISWMLFGILYFIVFDI